MLNWAGDVEEILCFRGASLLKSFCAGPQLFSTFSLGSGIESVNADLER